MGAIRRATDLCSITFDKAVYDRIMTTSATPSPSSASASAGGSAGGSAGVEDLYGLRYSFRLNDDAQSDAAAVDAPEWLVPLPLIRHLAKKSGLRLVMADNFHDFSKRLSESTLHQMNAFNAKGTLSEAEWSIVRLYMVLEFQKDSSVYDEEEEEEGGQGPMASAPAQPPPQANPAPPPPAPAHALPKMNDGELAMLKMKNTKKVGVGVGVGGCDKAWVSRVVLGGGWIWAGTTRHRSEALASAL